MLILSPEISLSEKKIKAILHDPKKSAAAAHLVYVHDNQQGITRTRRREGFIYQQGATRVRDEKSLTRIKKLVIPPAWEKVWICPVENGHIQATGLDLKNRKQYKYHSLWNALRNQTKFYRLHHLGASMPTMRQHLQKDLALPGLPLEKVLAAVVSLMELTSIRVGNSAYEKLYGSFGLTTLKDQHTTIKGSQIRFIFKGKKGVSHNISLKSKRLAAIIKQCRDIPGKELFQYYDHDGKRHTLDSGMVNAYLKTISGQDFTAKDFRTWAGSVHALAAFREVGTCETASGAKKNMVSVLDSVAKHLGNTRTVCKKYYVHPVLMSLYETNNLHPYFSKMNGRTTMEKKYQGLTEEEKLLMLILEKEGLTIH